ncbi:MAG: SemiSWEET transporter [Methanomassiliicoccales archaeon]|jgi:MtN3 and saliva related transmembrane protein|nr:SemiSWEET transporter [Methanomassiliicoccales archaeon]
MDQWTALGLVAGFLTTVGFVPQIVKGIRSRSMRDVSLIMPIFLGLGMLLWLLYGIWLESLPIILWNAVAFALNMVIIALKLLYGRNGGG